MGSLVRTPLGNHLIKCIKEARNKILIICPFIKVNVVDAILEKVPKYVDILTLTRLEKIDIVRGVSDIEALEKLMVRGEVRINSRVHAKLLIVDENAALISSANLTFSGLYYNFECGVFTDETNVVTRAVSFFKEVWEDMDTSPLTERELNEMKEFAYSEYRLMDTFEKLIDEGKHKGLYISDVNRLFQTYMELLEEEQWETVFNIVSNWIDKNTQPAKIIKLLVQRDNKWLSPKEISDFYPEIKDPGTVLYDLAKRGSREYYLRRPRYYPRRFFIKPFLEYDEKRGYRIKTKFFKVIVHAVRETT